MIYRCLTLLLTGAVCLGAVLADEEPPPQKEKGEAPFRLKRKKRDAEPGAEKGDKPAPKKEGEPGPANDTEKPIDKPKEKGKERAQDDEALIPEDGKPVEREDEQDILERVGRNLRAVEEKIGNREIGEPTQQQQRDILRDIDSLIRKSDQQGGGGGGGGGNNQPQDQNQDNQDQNQGQNNQPEKGNAGQGGGGQQKQSRAQQGGGGGGQSSRQQAQGGKRPRRELRSESGKQRGQPQPRMMAGGNQPQGGNQPRPMPGTGNNPGGGNNNTPPKPREIDVETYKDIWGHLPESLRAEMNAYSNPQPFLPRYDRLIREYYKTIAEQGRKKGD